MNWVPKIAGKTADPQWTEGPEVWTIQPQIRAQAPLPML
jgi:hypothetical protein